MAISQQFAFAQFLAEAILLSLTGGLAAALIIGVLARLLPAIRLPDTSTLEHRTGKLAYVYS